MKEGYIKLYRGIEDNPLWLQEPFTKSQAWIDILLLTNHKTGYIRLRNGEIVQIERGECGWSMESLAKRWQWSRGKVKRFLDYLKTQKMIQQTDIPNATIVKVLNYERFQNDTTNGQQIVRQTDTNKNGKNEKNITTILEFEEKFNFYGEYLNVFLEQKQYDRLLTMCLSESLLNELINSFSINIEVGKERPYTAELPNAHFERLKSYYNYRKKYPQKFNNEMKQAYKSKFEEQVQTDKVIDQWAEEFDKKYAEME